MIALRRFLQVLGAGLLCAATGCSDDGKTGQTPPSFAIIPPLSSFYRVTVAEEAAEGDPVRFTVALTDEEAHILSVRYNDRDCRLLSADERLREYVYGFTMPDEEVSLSVKVRKGPDEEPEEPEDPESETYGLVCEDSELYTFSGVPERAEPEQRIRFSLTVHTLPERILSLRSAEYCDARTGESLGECQVSEEKEAVPDGVRYDLLFRMPEADVVLKADVEELFGLTLRGDEHAGAVLADPGAFPTAGEGYAIPAGESVRFSIRTEPGYEAEYTLTGDRSGTPYEAVEVVGKDGYREFSMPGEPVTIAVASRESSRYEGEFFVGEYKGYPIRFSKDGIYRADAPTLSVSFGANETFRVRSTDENRFDFSGTYFFKEGYDLSDYVWNDSYSLNYVPETCGEFGITCNGEYRNEMIAAYVSRVDRVDRLKTNRYYIISKTDVTGYVSATDSYYSIVSSETPRARYSLLEFCTADGERHHFLADTYRRELVFMLIGIRIEFFTGSSIGDPDARAIVWELSYPEGIAEKEAPLFRYEARNGDPLIVETEAGEYLPKEGEGDVLMLDGFGRGTIGTREGTYTVSEENDGIVVFTTGGTTTAYRLRGDRYEVLSEAAA